MNTEMKTHMEEKRAKVAPSQPKSRCNGRREEAIKGEFGEAQIAVPYDRASEFEL